MKKINFKVSPKKITFWFYFVIVIASLTIFSYLSLFLYENFYKTIIQSEKIIILKQKVAIETINIKKFDTIMEKIKEKTTPKRVNGFNNPFD